MKLSDENSTYRVLFVITSMNDKTFAQDCTEFNSQLLSLLNQILS